MLRQKVCDEFSPKRFSRDTQAREGLHTLDITMLDPLWYSTVLQRANHTTCNRVVRLPLVVPEMKAFHQTSFITVVASNM